MNSHRRSPPNNLMKFEIRSGSSLGPKSGPKSGPKIWSEIRSEVRSEIRSEIQLDIIVKEKKDAKEKKEEKGFIHHNDEMAQCRT